MEFSLKINIGNDAMQTADDLADRILLVAEQVRTHNLIVEAVPVSDLNGNRVGLWRVQQ